MMNVRMEIEFVPLFLTMSWVRLIDMNYKAFGLDRQMPSWNKFSRKYESMKYDLQSMV